MQLDGVAMWRGAADGQAHTLSAAPHAPAPYLPSNPPSPPHLLHPHPVHPTLSPTPSPPHLPHQYHRRRLRPRRRLLPVPPRPGVPGRPQVAELHHQATPRGPRQEAVGGLDVPVPDVVAVEVRWGRSGVGGCLSVVTSEDCKSSCNP